MIPPEAIEAAAKALYAAGPWGEPFAFEDDGATLVSDAHSMPVYREMVRAAAPYLLSEEDRERLGKIADWIDGCGCRRVWKTPHAAFLRRLAAGEGER